jgi:nucleotidyltransferase substrate binding protein (TIGR01987 family)
MVDPKARYRADRALLQKALQSLQNALASPSNDISRDASIQRFEYVFELSWKTMQAACALQGITANSPKESIRGAFELGWISDPDAWFRALEARNATSHTYDESLAQQVFAVAQQFSPLVQRFLAMLAQKEP